MMTTEQLEAIREEELREMIAGEPLYRRMGGCAEALVYKTVAVKRCHCQPPGPARERASSAVRDIRAVESLPGVPGARAGLTPETWIEARCPGLEVTYGAWNREQWGRIFRETVRFVEGGWALGYEFQRHRDGTNIFLDAHTGAVSQTDLHHRHRHGREDSRAATLAGRSAEHVVVRWLASALSRPSGHAGPSAGHNHPGGSWAGGDLAAVRRMVELLGLDVDPADVASPCARHGARQPCGMCAAG